MRQYIHSRADIRLFNQHRTINSKFSRKPTFVDYVEQGYLPDFGWLNQPKPDKIGVLCTFNDELLASLEHPTLNMMVFDEKWCNDCVISQPGIKAAIDLGCYFMSDFHMDKDSVDFPDIAGRITNHYISEDKKKYLGSYDVLDTPKGRQIYLISKIATIATSTRGQGELTPLKSNLSYVEPSEYIHVCSDFVTFPAVPNTFTTSSSITFSGENLDSINQQLYSLIESGLQKSPKDQGLLAMKSLLSKKESSLTEQYRSLFKHLNNPNK